MRDAFFDQVNYAEKNKNTPEFIAKLRSNEVLAKSADERTTSPEGLNSAKMLDFLGKVKKEKVRLNKVTMNKVRRSSKEETKGLPDNMAQALSNVAKSEFGSKPKPGLGTRIKNWVKRQKPIMNANQGAAETPGNKDKSQNRRGPEGRG